jgi:hypothetical protein
MPTISMQLLPDWECDPDTPLYPLHQQIIEDRKGFRTEVMDQTGRSEDWVKKELSKLDNMDQYNTSFEILEDYFQEGLSIRDSVINRVQQSNPKMYHTAFSKAKNIINKTWDEELKQMRFIPTEEKKESSVFFFIWTQVERVIREAMKSVFQDQQSVIDCHDAVYSKEKVDIKAMEQAVLDQTGFVVKISH